MWKAVPWRDSAKYAASAVVVLHLNPCWVMSSTFAAAGESSKTSEPSLRDGETILIVAQAVGGDRVSGIP